MIRVFIGTDSDIHQDAEKVLEYSIRKHTKSPVEITFIQPGWKTPPTGFASHRYLIPKLCNYEGYAIYLDVDMIVLDDIAKLWEYRQKGKWCITNMDNRRGPRDEVSVIDCSEFTDLPPERILRTPMGKKHAKHTILVNGRYEGNIPVEWNMIDVLTNKTKLLHFSRMGTQPWHPDPTIDYNEHKCPEAVDLFFQYLDEAQNANV